MPSVNVRPLWIVGMVVYFIGLIGYIVGFARTEWFTVSKNWQFGLFQMCILSTGTCKDVGDLEMLGYVDWHTGQALTSVGLGILILACPVSIFIAVKGKALFLPVVSFLVFVGGGLGIAGGVHYMVTGHNYSETVSNSYSADWASLEFLVSCLVEIISGIFFLIGFCRRNRSPLRY